MREIILTDSLKCISIERIHGDGIEHNAESAKVKAPEVAEVLGKLTL